MLLASAGHNTHAKRQPLACSTVECSVQAALQVQGTHIGSDGVHQNPVPCCGRIGGMWVERIALPGDPQFCGFAPEPEQALASGDASGQTAPSISPQPSKYSGWQQGLHSVPVLHGLLGSGS